MTRNALLVVVALCAGTVALALVIGYRVVHVPSGSMSPLIPAGSWIVTAPVKAEGIRNGDVVVVQVPAQWRELLRRDGVTQDKVVKRVIALGGQKVECCGAAGALRLDDTPLTEPYLAEHTEDSTWPTFKVVVPEHQMWLLGDNRTESVDSRAVRSATASTGTVELSAVTGRFLTVLW